MPVCAASLRNLVRNAGQAVRGMSKVMAQRNATATHPSKAGDTDNLSGSEGAGSKPASQTTRRRSASTAASTGPGRSRAADIQQGR
jgi:Sec-independent protein translocase protein TatA